VKLPSNIRFLDKNLQDVFYKLEEGDNSKKELFRLINNALDDLEKNAFCGIQIPKKLIPKEYNVKNLWKYNLPHGWRLIYSVVDNKIIVISLILEWLNHKDYERRFKY